jgi:polar amino acid transport system ATP-binding protein
MTMLIVSHEMGFAAHVASTAIFMDDGRIVERGPPAQLFAAPRSDRLRAFLNTWRERSI